MERRDFIKWVIYLGATAALPAATSTKDLPHDVLEGLSSVDKRIADLSGDAPAYRAAEDDAFERTMREMWVRENGSAKYVRVFHDMGEVGPRKWKDAEGVVHDQPASYDSLFQYRRA